MLLYPEDLKECGFCPQSYKLFMTKYGGNPVEYETAKAYLMSYEAASENGKLEWINWANVKNIEENFEYLSKRASTSSPLDQFLFIEGGETYQNVQEAKVERDVFVEQLIGTIEARFNVTGHKLVVDDAYEILDVDLAKTYPEADYYRIVDRNAKEYIVYSQEEAELLIENLNQRDFAEAYSNFPIKQNYRFDDKYTAATVVE
jgi:hypothetical protein